MNWRDFIVSDKGVLLGKPVLSGTRVSVDHILSLLAQGWSEETILLNYPRVTKDHLQAVHVFLYECFKDGLLLDDGKISA